MNTITYYMLKDHRVLDELLKPILDGFGLDKAGLKANFQAFRDKLDKHMQTEEQAIFSFSDLGDAQTMQIVRELLVEHGSIRNRLEDLSLQIIKGEEPRDFEDFIGLLDRHQRIEGDVLYPKLDRELGDSEKKYILHKINSLN